MNISVIIWLIYVFTQTMDKISITNASNIIRKRMTQFMKRLFGLPIIPHNNLNIQYNNIQSFILSERRSNDKNNKIREITISAIVNNIVPNEYYIYSPRWKRLRNKINEYIFKMVKIKYPELHINTVSSIIRAGRGFNYDFTFTINELYEFNVELKFNADTIEDIPQFVSPMKPSQYLSQSYEEFHYIHYLNQISLFGNLTMPEKGIYLQQIHSPSPPCMKEYQDKYYRGCKQSSQYSGKEDDIIFYEKSKDLSKESITRFMEIADLDIAKLSSYLLSSQNEKYYMFYKDGGFHCRTSEMNNYQLISYSKYPEGAYYLATSLSGKRIKILLRWKNGNGIAFPSFQISLDTTKSKISNVKEKPYKSHKITKPKVTKTPILHFHMAEPKKIMKRNIENDMMEE